MTIQKILKFPNLKLRTIATPVKKVDKNIKKIIHDMLDTMYAYQGLGLAAPQINVHKQIIVISPIFPHKKNLILINPKILKKKKITKKFEEGCLSIPNKTAFLKRYNNLKLKAINYYGKKIILNTQELLSICIQHEMDHLIGKLFIDYLK
ncbi:peptide deformylase [Buchnera aphidicola]|uniref:peptide deformylase n=1 Tax=Buchnera aphidicola TaxID=9 RepID=UPI0031B6D534